MSLIDEALKRARLEAAQRAAESEGLPYPTIPRHLAPQRRRRWLVPAAVGLAVLAGLVIGLLAASRGGPPSDRVAAAGGGTAEPVTSGPATPAEVERDPPPPVEDPATPEDAAASAPPATEPALPAPARPAGPPAAAPVTSGPSGPAELVRDVGTPTPSAAPPVERPAERRPERRPDARPPAQDTPAVGGVPASPPRPAPGTVSPQPAAAAPTTAPRPATPAPEPQPAASAVTDPDSGVLLVLPERPQPEAPARASAPAAATPVENHVQQLPLPDGGAIELGGIAWSETGPFALINGRVVGPGAMIGAFTLERIQPGHVELSGGGRRVHLSLQ